MADDVNPKRHSATSATDERIAWSPRDLSDDRVAALRDALAALDGHGFRDTAHDRVRALLACGECGHRPEQHTDDGRGPCLTKVGAPRFLGTCPCIEWEIP